MTAEARSYRRYAIQAAKELCYGKTIVAELRKAKTEIEIARIMTTARGGIR